MIAENVKIVRERIASACQRAGRKPEEITLIAVTKTFGTEHALEAIDAGATDLGENYVRELQEKHNKLADRQVRWHFIGHLQSNKIKYVADWIHLIHSVDSMNLAKQLSQWGERRGRALDVLVEVNTTGEKRKFGFSVGEARKAIDELGNLRGLKVIGLMTMGPFLPDPEASRPAFRTLSALRDSISTDGHPMPHLSMGMTNDFEVAIEEGATMLRIGTAIFGSRSTRH